MLIIKGVNLYPAAIKSLVGEFVPLTTGALRIILDAPGPMVTPPLKLKVEFGQPDMAEAQKQRLQQELTAAIRDRLRVAPSIELVPPQSLPRKAGKTALITIKKNS